MNREEDVDVCGEGVIIEDTSISDDIILICGVGLTDTWDIWCDHGILNRVSGSVLKTTNCLCVPFCVGKYDEDVEPSAYDVNNFCGGTFDVGNKLRIYDVDNLSVEMSDDGVELEQCGVNIDVVEMYGVEECDINIFSVGAYDVEAELEPYNVNTFSLESTLLKLLSSEPRCSVDWKWSLVVVLIDGKDWSKTLDVIIPGDCMWWIRLDEGIATLIDSVSCFSDPIWWEDI